jgi:hypothetical protein
MFPLPVVMKLNLVEVIDLNLLELKVFLGL